MTAETKFTPGPWQVMPATHAQSCFIVGDHEGGSIADCEPAGPWMMGSTALANAHLISAAPDLYGSLERLLFDVFEDAHPDTVAAARAALAKARL